VTPGKAVCGPAQCLFYLECAAARAADAAWSHPHGCEVVATAALQRNGPVRRVASIGTGDRQAVMMVATTARVSGWCTLGPPPPGKRLLIAPPDDVPGAGEARLSVAGPRQFTLSS